MTQEQNAQGLPVTGQMGGAPGYPGYPGYNAGAYGGGAASSMHLWDYWAIVLKRWWLVLLFLVVSTTVAWFITQSQLPMYRATATIEILPPTVAGSEMSFSPVILSDDRYLETQLDKLRMDDVLEAAVKREELWRRKEFENTTSDEILRMAKNHVEVARRHDKYLIDVSVTGTAPRMLHHIANALVDQFCRMQISEAELRREFKRKELEDRMLSLRSQLQIANNEKLTTLELNHTNEHAFEYDLKFQQMRRDGYATDRDSAQKWLINNEAVSQAFEAARKGASETVIEDLARLAQVQLQPEVRQLQDRIAALDGERALLVREGYDTLHPKFQAWSREYERAQQERRRAIEGYVSGFLLEYSGKSTSFSRLNEQVEIVTGKLQELMTLSSTIEKHNLTIRATTAELESAQHDYTQLTQSQQPHQSQKTVIVSSAAREPTTPYAPNTRSNMIFGLVAGVIGGVGLAFLLDYLDDTVRTKDELAKVADVPLLGIVPRIDGGGSETEKKDLFAHAEPKSTISEAYRGVRTALTLSPHAHRQKVLLLTSAGPREGKTTTAINLATVLSYSGGRTLLIDADLRKPRIHKSFEVPNMRGLTNAIISGGDPMDFVQKTVCEGVDLLPSGPIPPNPSELLGHAKMREIITKLREHYEHIIVDTPPIGAVTDAAVLATMVDGVILVVHAGKTRRQIVSRGLEQLRYINANIVGVILNNLRVGRIRYYPGYSQYYYYYSHYGAEDAPPERKGPDKKPIA